MSDLSKKIGPTVLDHAGYLVRTTMLNATQLFFTRHFKWVVVRPAYGDGWRAVFMKPNWTESFFVQFTELKTRSSQAEILPGVHLGIRVKNAEVVARAIQDWYPCDISPANPERTKWFVSIPELFTFKLEFVTA